MTDGYKFSHHKQFPVSWMPEHARPKCPNCENCKSCCKEWMPPIIFPAQGDKQATKVLKLHAVPRLPGRSAEYKVTIVSNVSTAVQTVKPSSNTPDIIYTGEPVVYDGGTRSIITVALDDAQCSCLGFPQELKTFSFVNVDESKLKRGSDLNGNFEGAFNVSYFTPRAYSHVFSNMTGDNIVFFGLQYFIKEYLMGEVVTSAIVDEADAFIARYMADVRVTGQGVNHEDGFDHTMFPRGDWEAMITGDYDGTGLCSGAKGCLPIRIEALPEGTTTQPGTCLFKITNTHPRFYWLPNFLETLLVQVWYPTTVATQARAFKKAIQAASILSQRDSQCAGLTGMPGEFTAWSVAEDNLAIHVAQVFDLLDFGYRGVSSHETAALGSAAYYSAGLEGSDTVAGPRMLLSHYNSDDNFKKVFEDAHGATSIPAAEHSTITSWADVSPDADAETYEAAEYNAFRNMMKQYSPSFAVSLVSDGFNIWNAVTRLWASEVVPADGGASMRQLIAARLAANQLTTIRPDSGEGVETLPQLLTLLKLVLPEHFDAERSLPQMRSIFPAADPYEAKYQALVQKIRKKVGISKGNPFRRFKGQQMRVLQGDGVALDTVEDMLASVLANGFCANCVHFGSGGGLLQKVNRDSLAFAFKCCAMYVGDQAFPVGKDPIAGGKKSYSGNPPVVRNAQGVLQNRGEYAADGSMIRAQPMTYEEFRDGCESDELVKVFENGQLLVEQKFKDIVDRAKVKDLYPSLRSAVDNLEKKMDFFHKMTTDEAIACRFAEASCGSKWDQEHKTVLAEIKENFPQFSQTLESLGITEDMRACDVVQHIKVTHTCDKLTKSRVLWALGNGKPHEAMAAMEDKAVVTL